MLEEPEITTMSEKGQVVIPQSLRESLGIRPKTKLVVYVVKGAIVMKKLEIPDIKKEWAGIFQSMDRKNLKLDESDVVREIKSHRREKRKKARG